MRIIRVIFLVIIILLVNLYGKLVINEWKISTKEPEIKQYVEKKKEEKEVKIKSDSLVRMIEMNESEVLRKFGQPSRIDPSTYGYEWWIYNKYDTYMQFGIKNNKVVTVYGAGSEVDVDPFKIGQRYEELYNQQLPLDVISFQYKDESYEFMLSEDDLFERPLIKTGNAWVQLYFDKFTHTLSSIRIMDKETLLRYRPYKLTYTGELPLSQVEVDNVEQIERANAMQVFDLTNVIRRKHGVPVLSWNEDVAMMAYGHSRDMSINHYFDHISPRNEDLKARLVKSNIRYTIAGENIAKQYGDGIAAVEGWMNSEGHRVNMLNKDYTSLGVGVYEKFYTQNFIKK